MDKPNARELLKEVRGFLIYCRPINAHRVQNLIDSIDAYLVAPSESAMEMARAIEAAIKPQYIESPNRRGGVMVVSKDYTEAAALIEGYERRVPLKVLEALVMDGFYYGSTGKSHMTIDDVKQIAAKHGVVIE